MGNLNLIWLLLIFLLSNSRTIQSCEEDIIYWDNVNQLDWGNFLGNSEFADSSTYFASAVSYCDIIIDFDAYVDSIPSRFSIETVFYPNSSWVRIDEVSDNLLQHEQIHFNIYELHARILRRRLRELMIKGCASLINYQNEIDSTYLNINKLSKEFDEETSFGLKVEIQGNWLQLVNNRIEELNNYSKPHILRFGKEVQLLDTINAEHSSERE